MLMPKRVKFRRMQRGRMTGKATRGNTVSYGEYGLMALEPGWVKSNQRCHQVPPGTGGCPLPEIWRGAASGQPQAAHQDEDRCPHRGSR